MRVAGIIVEYNPLHNGHIEHLNDTRRLTNCDSIVAVMSGNFVQRGEPAICDKWRRTRMALNAGVDVVVEIPVGFVLGGAEAFARGSVGLLAATNVVDALCFGSESGDLDAMLAAGKILSQDDKTFREALRAGLNRGLSFAAARGDALSIAMKNVACATFPPDGLLTRPNNVLGIEYCKALWDLNLPMEVYTSHRIVRTTASGVRKGIFTGQNMASCMPEDAYNILMEAAVPGMLGQMDALSAVFQYILRTNHTLDVGEGLENRFRRFALEHWTISDILAAVKTKRYVYTRLQRTVMLMILGLSDVTVTALPYIRILGFRRDAAHLVGEIAKKASIPVLTHGTAMDDLTGYARAALEKEFESSAVYAMSYVGASGAPYTPERAMPLVVV